MWEVPPLLDPFGGEVSLLQGPLPALLDPFGGKVSPLLDPYGGKVPPLQGPSVGEVSHLLGPSMWKVRPLYDHLEVSPEKHLWTTEEPFEPRRCDVPVGESLGSRKEQNLQN